MPTNNLETELPTNTLVELIQRHGIDPGFFYSGTLHHGPSEAYLGGLERWGNQKCAETRVGQTGTRHHIWEWVREQARHGEGGWSLFSVATNRQGFPEAGLAFLGHRIHPSKRSPGRLRFDTTGWDETNRGVMLPPLSWYGAIDLLGSYGLDADPETYEPCQAWDFIFKNPEIPVWVEESALKAMAACSIGQLAVGLNGINCWGQKGRSDRLHPVLTKLARKGRQMVVRFDRPEREGSQSEQQARKLARALERQGARGGGWFCWLPDMPAKTDDVVAAIVRGELPAQKKCWLHCFGATTLPAGKPYRRLRDDWGGIQIDREFSPEDIVAAALAHKVIVLKGATGTAKTTAMVSGLELLEQTLCMIFVVLGGYHRASLCHKGATEFGVVNMSAPPGSAERLGLHEGRKMRDGLFCCGESAYKAGEEKSLWDWYWDLKEKPRPTILVLDEISQVLANWVMDGTDALRSKRHKALEALEGLIQLDCVRVWASDALVGDIEMAWLMNVSGTQPFLIQSNYTRARNLYMGYPSSLNERRLLQRLHETVRLDERFWLGHGTVTKLNRFMDSLPPAAEGTEIRITGEATRRDDPLIRLFHADSETVGATAKRVGFSPAMSCGTSMAQTPVALTAVVQDYQWKGEDVLQALNRARDSKMRILIAPKAAPGVAGVTRETTPERAAQAFKDLMTAGSIKDYSVLLEQRHPATKRAVAELEARTNLECYYNEWCLLGLLEQEGYQIRPMEELDLIDGVAVEADSSTRLLNAWTPEGVDRYRMEALQRLAFGQSTLEQEQGMAKRAATGGTFVDLAELDISEGWEVAQKLLLHHLIRAETVHAGSDEIRAVWAALGALDRDEAKRVARALRVRSDRIPGPMDQFDVRRIKPLVKALGFIIENAGKTRAEGKKWRLVAVDLGES